MPATLTPHAYVPMRAWSGCYVCLRSRWHAVHDNGPRPVANGVRTAAELRDLLVVGSRSRVVHHPSCAQVGRIVRGTVRPIGSDPRYLRGELVPGRCCGPVVPLPSAPPDAPGWQHALTLNAR